MALLWSKKHPLDVVRVGAWNSLYSFAMYLTLYHYYAASSEDNKHTKIFVRYVLSSVCLTLSQFSQLFRNSVSWDVFYTLHWRHNEHDGVSNHQPHGCLLNRLFRRRSKKTSKLRVTGLCVGNSPGPVNSPHKGPVTRKMFPFDDVIMIELAPNILFHTHEACLFSVLLTPLPYELILGFFRLGKWNRVTTFSWTSGLGPYIMS